MNKNTQRLIVEGVLLVIGCVGTYFASRPTQAERECLEKHLPKEAVKSTSTAKDERAS